MQFFRLASVGASVEKTVIKKPKERKATEVKEVIMEDVRTDEVGERQETKPAKDGGKVGVNAEGISTFI